MIYLLFAASSVALATVVSVVCLFKRTPLRAVLSVTD